MAEFIELYDSLLNKRTKDAFRIANVSSVSPLQIKLYPSDNAIPANSIIGLVGLKVGSTVIMVYYKNKFTIIGVIGTPIIVDSTKKVIVKQASQGSTTASSFTTDSELSATLEPNKLYKVHFNLVVNNSSGTPDMLINFIPSGTITLYGSIHFRCMSVNGTNAAAYEEGKTSCYTSIDADIYIGLASGYGSARGTMLLKGGASGGAIGVKFKQRYTDGANASYIRVGSYIEYYEVQEIT